MAEVIVVGSALVELTPEKPGQSLVEVERLVPLPSGAAANVALAMAHLGASVGFLTRVGEDELGEWLLRRLVGEGIEPDLMGKVSGQLTPCSFCWADLAGRKQFYFYRFPGFSDPMATLSAQDLPDEALRQARLFDFTEATIRSEPLRSVTLELARRARGLGLQVCYAVNWRPASWSVPLEEAVEVQRQALSSADIGVMNQEEAELILGTAEPREAARAAQALGPRIAAITCGNQGAVVADQELYWIPSRMVPVRYDVGAGDTFHAGLVAALLQGLTAEQAGLFASIAAALKISRPADAPHPSLEEVLERGGRGTTL